jgi:transcriptional regulator with XRE-family HTH domain
MSETTASGRRLASRLRELREALGKTQKEIAEELHVSVPTVSSWENTRSRTAVPDERLARYARLLTPHDGDEASEVAAARLESELRALREHAVAGDGDSRFEPGRLGGRFWHFPDQQRVTLVGTPLAPGLLRDIPYANPEHPNYIRSLYNADIDATIELFGHVRAENPDSEVGFTTTDRVASDELTGHVVVLGAADYRDAMVGNQAARWFLERMSLPVRVGEVPGGDPEYDRWMVVSVDAEQHPRFGGSGERTFQPIFREAEGTSDSEAGTPYRAPLDYDLAVLARQPNPLNSQATLTVCMGLFSRGTYGAVRVFTDAQLRKANEAYLYDTFPDPGNFWIILRVPVFGQTTVTPDLGRTFTRVLEWSPPANG